MKYGKAKQLWNKIPDLDGVPAAEVPVMEYYPAQGDSKKRGTVLIYPGGGYGGRAGHEGITIANWLNYQGINAWVVHYRVAPHKHPVPLADGQRAVRLARQFHQEIGQVNQKIGVIGFSAGGHLAATVATMHARAVYPAQDAADQLSARPDAVILGYPVATFTEHTHNGTLQNLLGEKANTPLRGEMSPEAAVDQETPPCFIWHTADDGAVKVQNALLFSLALANAGIPQEVHIYPTGPHGLGTISYDYVEVCRDWTWAAQKWLFKQGF